MNLKQTFHAIGLMSGTSLDGLDLVYAKFWKEGFSWNYEIIDHSFETYTKSLRSKLLDIHLKDYKQIKDIDHRLGSFVGEQCSQFAEGKQVDLVAFPGHTVFHRPDSRITLQIGDAHIINQKSGIEVIYDFRRSDVLQEGQGAPLVPIGDRLLFGKYQACLNLGGFSNISFDQGGKRIAFDICPVNTILNHLASLKEKPYDKDGSLANSGSVNPALLNQLDSLKYYRSPIPKTLGVEWNDANFYPVLESFKISIEDKLATCVEHMANQLSAVINSQKFEDILVTGGGARNTYLVERLRNKSKGKIVIPDTNTIDYKEALIFAFMGVLFKLREINCLSSVTGAIQDHVAGRSTAC